MTIRIRVEYTNRPFGITEEPTGWKLWGQATTARGLVRVARAAYQWTHPQHNAYTGHVRLTIDGSQVHWEGALFALAEPSHSPYDCDSDGMGFARYL